MANIKEMFIGLSKVLESPLHDVVTIIMAIVVDLSKL